jgi:hypothetical protein
MEGVRRKSQSNGEHGDTGCGGTNHLKATCYVFRDAKTHECNNDA